MAQEFSIDPWDGDESADMRRQWRRSQIGRFDPQTFTLAPAMDRGLATKQPAEWLNDVDPWKEAPAPFPSSRLAQGASTLGSENSDSESTPYEFRPPDSIFKGSGSDISTSPSAKLWGGRANGGEPGADIVQPQEFSMNGTGAEWLKEPRPIPQPATTGVSANPKQDLVPPAVSTRVAPGNASVAPAQPRSDVPISTEVWRRGLTELGEKRRALEIAKRKMSKYGGEPELFQRQLNNLRAGSEGKQEDAPVVRRLRVVEQQWRKWKSNHPEYEGIKSEIDGLEGSVREAEQRRAENSAEGNSDRPPALSRLSPGAEESADPEVRNAAKTWRNMQGRLARGEALSDSQRYMLQLAETDLMRRGILASEDKPKSVMVFDPEGMVLREVPPDSRRVPKSMPPQTDGDPGFDWTYMGKGMLNDVFGIGGMGDRISQGFVSLGDNLGYLIAENRGDANGYVGTSDLYHHVAQDPQAYNEDQLRADAAIGGLRGMADVATSGVSEAIPYTIAVSKGDWEGAQDAALSGLQGAASMRGAKGKVQNSIANRAKVEAPPKDPVRMSGANEGEWSSKLREDLHIDPAREKELNTYRDSLKTKATRTDNEHFRFQSRLLGSEERLIEGGGVKLWADDVAGDTILDAKHVSNPQRTHSSTILKFPLTCGR